MKEEDSLPEYGDFMLLQCKVRINFPRNSLPRITLPPLGWPQRHFPWDLEGGSRVAVVTLRPHRWLQSPGCLAGGEQQLSQALPLSPGLPAQLVQVCQALREKRTRDFAGHSHHLVELQQLLETGVCSLLTLWGPAHPFSSFWSGCPADPIFLYRHFQLNRRSKQLPAL